MFKHNQSNTNNSWLRLVAIIVPVLIVFLGVSYFAVNSWYGDNLKPVSASVGEDVTVVIEEGTGVRAIADQLSALGIIRNSTVFSWYVERQGDDVGLQAGTYHLNPMQSVEEIVEILSEGRVATDLFTILPGKRLDQLQASFIDFGFEKADVSSAFNAKYEHPLFIDLPTNATLEGYVFPETYQITIESTPRDILTESFDEFYARLDKDLLAGIEEQGLTLHEAVTLGSIVEKESGNVDDQPTIAQVFLKRLNEGMVLGSDVTFFYAAAVTGERASPELDSPYNTRIYAGLPPGPISNFNLTALGAVAAPNDTDWLYFVAGDDGVTYFSKNVQDHQALVDQYCIELCKLPQ